MHSFEKTIYYAILITSIVLGIVFAFFTVTIIRNQRRHYKALQARLLAEIGLLENERTRIAHDLHDELGPLLSVIRIQVTEANDHPNIKTELLQKAIKNILDMAQKLDEIAFNLTPAQLVRKGLGVVLHDFFEQYREISPIKLVFRYEVKNDIEHNTALHIYRIVQEIVNNSVKHSGASVIDVHLKERNRKLYILCKDNGKGIEEDKLNNNKRGIGLNSLKSRTEMLGGRMQFQSKNGTEYFIEIPLSKQHG